MKDVTIRASDGHVISYLKVRAVFSLNDGECQLIPDLLDEDTNCVQVKVEGIPFRSICWVVEAYEMPIG